MNAIVQDKEKTIRHCIEQARADVFLLVAGLLPHSTDSAIIKDKYEENRAQLMARLCKMVDAVKDSSLSFELNEDWYVVARGMDGPQAEARITGYGRRVFFELFSDAAEDLSSVCIEPVDEQNIGYFKDALRSAQDCALNIFEFGDKASLISIKTVLDDVRNMSGELPAEPNKDVQVWHYPRLNKM